MADAASAAVNGSYGCPLQCGFEGPAIYDHVHKKHCDSGEAVCFNQAVTVTMQRSVPLGRVLLHTSSEQVLVLLNCGGDDASSTRSLRRVTVGPPPTANHDYSIEFDHPVEKKRSAVPWSRGLELVNMSEEGDVAILNKQWSSSGSLTVTARFF